jgi:hypothetical protein
VLRIILAELKSLLVGYNHKAVRVPKSRLVLQIQFAQDGET